MTDTRSNGWDHSVDLLIIGSGAGAMTASIVAHDNGADALLIEKTDLYGGNSAMSGGAMWVPCNAQMAAAGVADTPPEALTYLKKITEGQVSDERLKAYIDTAPKMIDYLCTNARLRVDAMLTYADYYADEPGGKPGGRSLEPQHFDAKLLGDEFDRMREPALQELVFGRMSMSATEAHHLLARHPGWIKLTTKIMARYWKDLRWRTRSRRDRCLSLGNALVGMLRMSLLDRSIPIWLNTPARELIVENGRVVGVLAEKEGKPFRIEAKKGVVLSAGGFESNNEMRKNNLPDPTDASWTSGSPASQGDGHKMAERLGVQMGCMDDAWWGPTTVVPGEARARVLVVEKGLPGCIFVSKGGKRFVNEASPYAEVVKQMYRKTTAQDPTVPAYMIFDTSYRKKYPCGPFLQAQQQPDWMLPKKYTQDYLAKADTLEELAGKMGVDPKGLADTVAAFNENARKGIDPDFQRGEGIFDRYYGDEKVKPNPCLAPLETPPYYGIVAYAGEFGTKGGVMTDVNARALSSQGEPISGLYCIGNNSAAVMGPTYAGAGATIGPAMTFGFIAGHHALGLWQEEPIAKAS